MVSISLTIAAISVAIALVFMCAVAYVLWLRWEMKNAPTVIDKVTLPFKLLEAENMFVEKTKEED